MPDTYGNTARGVTANPVTGSGYYNVVAGLIDHSSYGPIGSGGWQVVDRPKRVSATQWFDRAPYKIDITILLDKSVTSASSSSQSSAGGTKSSGLLRSAITTFSGNQGSINSVTDPTGTAPSVELDCLQIEKWLEPIPTILEPPTLMIDGPVPGTNRTWILYSVSFDEAIRDFVSGQRVQQIVKITLYEYNSPLASATHKAKYSPASVWTENSITSQVVQNRSYTIKTGDTIQSISGSNGSDYAQSILDANNIRDPAMVRYMVGRVISLP
jgi:hypothetical protein